MEVFFAEEISQIIDMRELGFKFYLLFMASWFLHLGSRVPFLGSIRIDFTLVLILMLIIFLDIKRYEANEIRTDTEKALKLLIIYILITIPFVQWPGSVVRYGIVNFIKGIVFFYFTVHFVTSEKKLKIFIATFIALQFFRVIEPLYLHITEGYWGSEAMMSNWEFMNRLSGAPHDIINPNGLAYVIVSVIPFFYYLAKLNLKTKFIFILAMPPCFYALALTGSRSGIIALIIIYVGIVIKSHKKIFFVIFGIAISVMLFARLSPDLQERYISIVDPTTQHSDTARGRIEGMKKSFGIALHNPFFGHGIGTNGEATWNIRRWTSISHILYGEVAIELGYIGLIIFLVFLKSIITNFMECSRLINDRGGKDSLLPSMNNSMQLYLVMNIAFSFASYGLSGYVWYLLAGLSVVMRNLCDTSYKMEEIDSRESTSLADAKTLQTYNY